MLRRLIPLLVVAIGAGPEEVAMKDVARGNNQFAVDLYGKVRGGTGNVFFSPYSISAALAMTSAGARGETARQMADTLHFPADGEALHSAFAGLDAQINGGPEPRPYQLSTANALWGQQGLNFRPEFLKLTETYYRAGLRQVDFAGNPEAARKRINGWVEEQTRDKIKDLIGSGAIRRDTELVLTNAIYFKGAWSVPFSRPATKDEDFATLGKRSPVPMMHRTGSLNYLDGVGFQALELPYAGNALSMVVLLPKKADGLGDLEATLTGPKLDGWLAKLSWAGRSRFRCPGSSWNAGSSLKKRRRCRRWGCRWRSAAEESRTSRGSARDRKLFISAVIHKAFVDVNEEGTEAAAATAVTDDSASHGDGLQEPPVVFRADHPFLFLIRDVRSGSILFLGRVTEPEGLAADRQMGSSGRDPVVQSRTGMC